MPLPKPSASCAAKFARLLQLALLRQRSAGGPVAAEFLTLVTTSDNTNSDAATNGQHTPTLVCSKQSLLALSYSATPEHHLARSPAISGSREIWPSQVSLSAAHAYA